jgi:glycogen debranching enzyme
VTPLKSNHCYAILGAEGDVQAFGNGVQGVFLFDTRHLSELGWNLAGFDLLHVETTGDAITQYWSRTADHELKLLIKRQLRLTPTGLSDSLEIENSSAAAQSFDAAPMISADFVDIFLLRGRTGFLQTGTHTSADDGVNRRFTYTAPDGVVSETIVDIEGLEPGKALIIAAHQKHLVTVICRFRSSLLITGRDDQIPSLAFDPAPVWHNSPAVARARTDIEALLLSSAEGPVPAAGIPNFVTVFGRDSLITAWFMLDVMPDLARNTLRYLAARIGRTVDPFRDEEPGRILHEVRQGEMSRLKALPFGLYYGAADANALFLRLLSDYCDRYGPSLAIELREAWIAVEGWIDAMISRRGYVAFTASKGQGLVIKSWKDSDDSMHYADGQLATDDVAGVELQGYAYAGFLAAARLAPLCGLAEGQARAWHDKAEALATRFNADFWMERHQTYALGLDGDGRQLDVTASNAGHLLWTGIVPKARQKILAERLFRDDLWSGWGIRTLGTNEARYNPLSYHNGSVWPHDNALIAAGLLACGFTAECERIRNALHDLAMTQPDLRLPELFGGYPRATHPPLPYLESCRPQAWAAAALLYLETAQTPVLKEADRGTTAA